MFFKKRSAGDNDDDQFSELFADQGVADGIKRALQRPDLTPEDRKELEDALQRLNLQKKDDT